MQKRVNEFEAELREELTRIRPNTDREIVDLVIAMAVEQTEGQRQKDKGERHSQLLADIGWAAVCVIGVVWIWLVTVASFVALKGGLR